MPADSREIWFIRRQDDRPEYPTINWHFTSRRILDSSHLRSCKIATLWLCSGMIPQSMLANWKPVLSGVGYVVPPREELKEDSPTVLQQFRNEYLVVYESVDPIGPNITRNSHHVFEAISICLNRICIGDILRRLTYYAICPSSDLPYLTSLETLGALRESDWLDDYIMDAEKFSPPSAESKENKS